MRKWLRWLLVAVLATSYFIIPPFAIASDLSGAPAFSSVGLCSANPACASQLAGALSATPSVIPAVNPALPSTIVGIAAIAYAGSQWQNSPYNPSGTGIIFGIAQAWLDGAMRDYAGAWRIGYPPVVNGLATGGWIGGAYPTYAAAYSAYQIVLTIYPTAVLLPWNDPPAPTWNNASQTQRNAAWASKSLGAKIGALASTPTVSPVQDVNAAAAAVAAIAGSGTVAAAPDIGGALAAAAAAEASAGKPSSTDSVTGLNTPAVPGVQPKIFYDSRNFVAHAIHVFSNKFPFDIFGTSSVSGTIGTQCPQFTFFFWKFEFCFILTIFQFARWAVVISYSIRTFISL